jgi:hypothetical protein
MSLAYAPVSEIDRSRVRCLPWIPRNRFHAFEWAAEINSAAHRPCAVIDGREERLTWNQPTKIEVSAGLPHKLQVFIRLIGLHWCGAETEVMLRDEEAADFQYRLELLR